MFPITIRNSASGEEKSFSNQQAVANFLAVAPDAKKWTGHEFTGGLPKPDPEFLRHHAEEKAREAKDAAASAKAPSKAKAPAPKAKAAAKPAKKAPAKKAAPKKSAKAKRR
jgi:hypothetical protein